jgi:small multidrug resistance pump
MKWVYFFSAVFFEILGTILLKMSDGNTKMLYTVLSYSAYGICFFVFGKAIKDLDLGIAYAMWSGIGIVVTTFIGIWYFNDNASLLKYFFIVMILVGVIGLNLIQNNQE